MSTLGRTRLRIAGDTARFDAPLESARRATPQFWRGTDLQFEIGVFHNGTLLSVANLASLTLELRPLGASGLAPDPGTAPAMARTIEEMDDTVTAETWADGTKQHALVPFSNIESNVAPGLYWLSLWVMTNDDPARLVTLAAGPLRVLEDGAGPTASPPSTPDAYLTAAQSDAAFARRSQNLGDLASVSAARTNLGLGTAAVKNAPSVGDAASGETVLGNDTRLSNARTPTAHSHPQSEVTNLVSDLAGKAAASHTHPQSEVTGLVSDLAAKAPLASPALTGTPTAPTANVGTKTVQLATTDFATCMHLANALTREPVAGMSTGASGSGSASVVGLIGTLLASGATGTAYIRSATSACLRQRTANRVQIDWSRPIWFGVRIYSSITAGGVVRVTLGKETEGVGALAGKGIGFEVYFSSGIKVKTITHNGTSGSESTGSAAGGFDLICHSDGAGNVSTYYVLNGVVTLLNTTAGGPTSASSNYKTRFQVEISEPGTDFVEVHFHAPAIFAP